MSQIRKSDKAKKSEIKGRHFARVEIIVTLLKEYNIDPMMWKGIPDGYFTQDKSKPDER